MKKFVKSGLVLVLPQKGKTMTAYSAAKSRERSMDDILASIRKVIADDMKQDSSQPTTAKVIELTQMVQDDGSIVDIKSYKDREAPAMDTSSFLPEQSVDTLDENNVAPKQNQTELDALFDTFTQGAETQEYEAQSSETQVYETQGYDTQGDAQPAPVLEKDMPFYDNRTGFAEAQAQTQGSFSQGSAENPFSHELPLNLVSQSVIQESLAAFSKLTEVAHNHPDGVHVAVSTSSQDIGQKSLEGLMRELLIPLLKNWLDSNLPSLVKWIVAEEIQKILKQTPKG